MPRISPKGGAVKNVIELPKGMPAKIDAYDELNV